MAAKRIIPPDEPSRDIAKATAENREKRGNLIQSNMATLMEMNSGRLTWAGIIEFCYNIIII